MKRIFIITLLLGILLPAAQAESPVIAAADSAYMADEYTKAVELYKQAISTEGPSAKLYYNLGNAYYRLGENGNAILSYERSLRVDPADKDARDNLDFVNARITDRPGERGTFLGNSLDAAAESMQSDTWAWIGFATFALTLAALITYLFANAVSLRKVGFFGGIVTLIICGISVFMAARSASISLADDMAIVTAPSTILSTSPRAPKDREQEAMLLHEGTRIQILDSVRTSTDSVAPLWYDVQVDNSHRAWINANDVEKI